MKMEVDGPSGLHEYWGKPVENWYDYFMLHEKLGALLQEPTKNKVVIARLSVQFAEQAVLADTEEKVLMAKQMPSDDVLFAQRKAACLWLCSMSCFSAINWNFLILLENHDVQSVKPVMDYTFHMFRNADLVADPSFGNWLMDKFVLAVDYCYRLPPPSAKQTVNNPAQTADTCLIRHETNRRIIQEIRERVPAVVQAMEALAVEGKTIYVPGYHCFFDPYVQGGTHALNIGILGHDVLVEGPPTPDLNKQCDLIPAKDVANRARFDLAVISFSDCQVRDAKSHLSKLTGHCGEHSLAAIDPQEASGYFMALGMHSPFPQQCTSRDDTITEALALDDSAPERHFALHRKRQETNSTGSHQALIRNENLAFDIVDASLIIVRPLLDTTNSTRLVQAILRRLPRMRNDEHRRRIHALFHHLTATVAGFKELLVQLNVDASWLREIAVPLSKTAEQSPQQPIIKALLQCGDPYWTMLTSFDIEEIKDSVAKSLPFQSPHRFRFPELLSEFVPVPPSNELLLVVLIAKLHQLGHLWNVPEWQSLCNGVIPIIASSPSNNANSVKDRLLVKAVLEAMYVQTSKYNQLMHIPWDLYDSNSIQSHLRTLKAMVNDPKNLQNFTSNPLLAKEAIAFCLNSKDFDFVMRLELNVSLMTLARLMAAFGSNASASGEGLEEFVRAWFQQIRPLFEYRVITRRGTDTMAIREVNKNRVAFIKFIKLIREPNLLGFLVSFFAHMLNHTITLDKKPNLKVFVQQSALFSMDLDLPKPHHIAIEECLAVVLRNALETNPLNAFWIRTAADFKYVKGEIEEAAALYMEAILSCRSDLVPPFPDNVIDDVLWSRLRVCFNRMKCHTMAALVCQLMSRSRKEEEYHKAVEIITSQPTLDAGADSCSMMFDHAMAELLSTSYDTTRQFNSLENMFKWASIPAINPNNRPEIFAREQNRRCERLLRAVAAQVFGTGL